MKYCEYNENKQHGRHDFPIEIYRVDYKHPQYIMPLHWHKELEIIRVLTGELDLFINNVPYTVKPGDIAFVNCKCPHRGEPHNCRYECVVCDLSMLVKKGNETYSSYINPIILGNLFINTIFHEDNSKLYSTINMLFALLSNKPPYYELSTIGCLFTLLEQLYLNNGISKINLSAKSISQTKIISELIDWIDNNYTEHITLNMLSDKAGVTPNYLCRIFKEYTGKSAIEYINSVRIDNICHEIKWGQKNITEAATDNGYNDISYFCKVFKKQKGISAKQYAKENRK